MTFSLRAGTNNDAFLQINDADKLKLNAATPLIDLAEVYKLLTGPRFRAYPSGSNGISNSVFTQIPLDAENFDPSNAVSSNRFQPTVAGYYAINWATGVTNISAATLILIVGGLFKNGVEYSRTHQSVPAGNAQGNVQGGDIVYMNGTTDYLDLRVYATISSGTLVIQGGNGGNFTFLAGRYIGT